MRINSRIVKAVPVVASVALVLAACGSDGDSSPVAQQPAADVPAAAAPEAAAEEAPAAEAPAAKEDAKEAAPAAEAPAAQAPAAGAAKTEKAATPAKAEKAAKPAAKAEKVAPAKKAKSGGVLAEDLTEVKDTESASEKAANQKIYDEKNGATEVGVTKDQIKLGSINMHGMA
ncbi:MAG: hypothetical protein ACT4QG_04380, partial [Sporichthyaceae bacterium]